MDIPHNDGKDQEFSGEFAKFPLKKRRFLEGFAATGSISTASDHAGVSRRTHLTWRAKDKAFLAACEIALEIACELFEREAMRRAKDGVLVPVYQGGKEVGAIRRYSDLLLIFLLRAMKPEKYRDGYDRVPTDLNASNAEDTRKSLHKKLERLAAATAPALPDQKAPPTQ